MPIIWWLGTQLNGKLLHYKVYNETSVPLEQYYVIITSSLMGGIHDGYDREVQGHYGKQHECAAGQGRGPGENDRPVPTELEQRLG